MNIFSGVVIFILVWWMVFFCSLPFGIKNIDQPKDGSMPGAPVNAGIKGKMIVSTAISAVVWLVVYGVIKLDLISFHDMAQKMSM